MATYRVGVIGFAHSHVNGLMRAFGALPEVEWVACADTAPDVPPAADFIGNRAWSLRYARDAIGIPRVYDDYRALLAAERCDLVICCAENARHGEIGEATAAHGAHLVVEKPMATSLDDARRMARAAERHGVAVFVNWPTTWSPAIRAAKALLDAGAIGRLWQVKWRGGSLGPLSHGNHLVDAAGAPLAGPGGAPVEPGDDVRGSTWWYRAGTGGGALLDYCCYGACLARWYVGEPAVAAQGLAANLASPYGAVDDNAVITARFPGALAILEATWTTVDHGVPTGPILYGTTGTLVVERRGARQVVRLARGGGDPPEELAAAPLPAGRETIAQEVRRHLQTGEPVHPTLEARFNLEAMALLDAGIRSAASGRLEPVWHAPAGPA